VVLLALHVLNIAYGGTPTATIPNLESQESCDQGFISLAFDEATHKLGSTCLFPIHGPLQGVEAVPAETKFVKRNFYSSTSSFSNLLGTGRL